MQSPRPTSVTWRVSTGSPAFGVRKNGSLDNLRILPVPIAVSTDECSAHAQTPQEPTPTYYWKLKLPGYIIRHSAVSGNYLTWVVTSGQGVFRIEAVSQLP
jgi:hypothetical protein